MESSLEWLKRMGVHLKKIYDEILDKVYGLPQIKTQLDTIEAKIDSQAPYVDGTLYVGKDVVTTETGHRLSEKLTQEQTQALINVSMGYVGSLSMEVVEHLPVSGITYRIYFVFNPDTGKFDEYMWINASWQKVGDTELDLSGYLEQIVTIPDLYKGNIDNAAAIEGIKTILGDHIANGRIHTSVENEVSGETITFNWNAS